MDAAAAAAPAASAAAGGAAHRRASRWWWWSTTINKIGGQNGIVRKGNCGRKFGRRASASSESELVAL